MKYHMVGVILLLFSFFAYADKWIVVSDSDKLTAIEPLVQYRQSQGYTYQWIDSEYMSKEQIKEAIRNAVDGKTFVLLVGLNDSIPTWQQTKTYLFTYPWAIGVRLDETQKARSVKNVTFSYNGDNDYADINDDLFPEIYVGRFPSNDLMELKNMVDKTIYFENNNIIANKRALFLAGPQRIPINAWETMTHFNRYYIPYYINWTIDRVYCYNANETSPLFNSVYEPEIGLCGTTHLIAANKMQENQTFIFYRGHGAQSWSITCSNINPKIDIVSNNPFIAMADACSTINVVGSKYAGYLSNNLMMRPTGAVAYIGSNMNIGMSITPDGLGRQLVINETLGEAFVASKISATVKPEITSGYYDLLGDPALSLKEMMRETKIVEQIEETPTSFNVGNFTINYHDVCCGRKLLTISLNGIELMSMDDEGNFY